MNLYKYCRSIICKHKQCSLILIFSFDGAVTGIAFYTSSGSPLFACLSNRAILKYDVSNKTNQNGILDVSTFYDLLKESETMIDPILPVTMYKVCKQTERLARMGRFKAFSTRLSDSNSAIIFNTCCDDKIFLCIHADTSLQKPIWEKMTQDIELTLNKEQIVNILLTYVD